MAIIRTSLDMFIGDSTETKPTGENWLPNGVLWWEPDTGDYYRYLLATEVWERLNITASP